MASEKRACLIYVTATEHLREGVARELADKGYVVCEVEAALEDAELAQAGRADVPTALRDCIVNSELSVFLLPEDKAQDGALSAGAGLARELGKRIIGIVSSGRAERPQIFDDVAESVICETSPRLRDAIDGKEPWEGPDGKTITAPRKITHIECQ